MIQPQHWSLKCIIGNLKHASYGHLIDNMKNQRKAFEETLCRRCPMFYSPQKYYALESYLGIKSRIKKAMNFTPPSFARSI